MNADEMEKQTHYKGKGVCRGDSRSSKRENTMQTEEPVGVCSQGVTEELAFSCYTITSHQELRPPLSVISRTLNQSYNIDWLG